MNTKAKRLLVAGLAVASLAIWIPQIMGMISADPPPAETVMPALSGDVEATAAPRPGAESGSGEALSGPAASQPMPGVIPSTAHGTASRGTDAGTPRPDAPTTQDTAPGTNAAGTPSMTALLSSLRESVDTLKQTQVPGGRRSLEDLASAWSRKHEAPPSTTAPDQHPETRTTPNVTTASHTDDGDLVSTRDDDAVRDFVRAQDVRMILLGTDKKLACLGTELVQEGDELFAGRVIVRRIERKCVVLEANGREMRVNLRAFEPRATSTTSSAPTAKSMAAPAAAPNTAPASTPAPNPPAAAPASAASTPPPKGA